MISVRVLHLFHNNSDEVQLIYLLQVNAVQLSVPKLLLLNSLLYYKSRLLTPALYCAVPEICACNEYHWLAVLGAQLGTCDLWRGSFLDVSNSLDGSMFWDSSISFKNANMVLIIFLKDFVLSILRYGLVVKILSKTGMHNFGTAVVNLIFYRKQKCSFMRARPTQQLSINEQSRI